MRSSWLNYRFQDDARDITARFNLDILARINAELGAAIDIASFHHRALYNRAEGRIEMHLVSRCDQTFSVCGCSFRMKAGETIHTGNSHKYAVDAFRRLAASAGWRAREAWTDPD